MKKKNISFKDIYKIYELEGEERDKWVWKNAPLNEVILDMAVKHLPNPLEAQKYRKEICAGRLYSGTIVNGMEVWANNAKKKGKIQQVLVYNGIKPEQMESVPAGNVLAISGLDIDVGETITLKEQTSFEEIKHLFQPVITKSIEVTKSADLPKLIEVLRKVSKEDPSIKVEINEQTGESLISGMGELHLEIIENRIKTEKGLEVKTSAPIIVYRETAKKESPVKEGRSPNKHNGFFIKVAPLDAELDEAIQSGSLPEIRVKKKNDQVTNTLSAMGWGSDEIRNIKDIYKGNVLFDETRGEVHIGEVIEMEWMLLKK